MTDIQGDNFQGIFGLNQPKDVYDIHMSRMQARFQSEEVGLYAQKWFDYRFMTPSEASYFYAHEFVKAYRRHFRINIDRDDAERVKPMRKEDLFTNSATFVSGIWRGRQFADALGMPYDHYLDGALYYRLRYWRQTHLPRPHQLYQEDSRYSDDMRQTWFVNAITKNWEEKQSSMLFYSRHPNYKNDRYIGTRDQNDHHEWLIKQMKLRMNPAPLLKRLIDEEFIPLEKVQERFDPLVVERIPTY
jgi:hypothetical protein